MKIKYLKLKNWLILSVMGVFGLSACHSHKNLVKDEDKQKDNNGVDVSLPVLMYGVPTTDLRSDTIEMVRDEEQWSKPKVEQPNPREPQVTVYGVPTVDFSVKGRVVDANGKPVKGLHVLLIDSRIDPDNLPQNEYWDAELRRMSDTTDAQGGFEVNGSDRPWEKMRVMVRDIDGAKNGSFEQQLVDIEFGEPESGNKPVSQWQLGTKKAEILIKMKRKKK